MVWTPENVLELAGIELDSRPGILWRSLVWKMMDGMTVAEAVNDTARQQHMPRAAVYAAMKRALAPVFGAMASAPDEWRARGLEPQSSTVGLAREIVRSMREGDNNGLEAGQQSKAGSE